jgi:hypothetical protein
MCERVYIVWKSNCICHSVHIQHAKQSKLLLSEYSTIIQRNPSAVVSISCALRQIETTRPLFDTQKHALVECEYGSLLRKFIIEYKHVTR